MPRQVPPRPLLPLSLMKHTVAIVVAVTLATLAFQSPLGAQSPTGYAPPQKARLVAQAEQEAYAPGETAIIELLIEVDAGWHVNSRKPTYEYLIPTEAHVDVPAGWSKPRMTYPEGSLQTFAFADEPLSVYDGQFVVTAATVVPANADEGTTSIPTSVRYQACNDRSCLPPATASSSVRLEISDSGADPAGVASPPPPSDRPSGFGLFLVFGLLGGLLLNAMPCVLPVLSLKLMGLVKSAAQDRKAVVAGSLATAAGILISFLALAAAAILARSLGASVGWGIQFQQPVFVTALAVVVLLFCLNLWGLFEVPLPRRLAGWAANTGGEGLGAHFSAGLFATLMATPCSAPFLGTAVGFALAQSSAVILAIFTAVGIGMALPYLLLAAAPGAIRLLPKPGVWMEHFRYFMGFLLAAAAVWLLYVLSSQVSRERLAFIEIAMLVLALFVWIRARAGSSRTWRLLAATGAMAAVAVSLVLAASGPAIGASKAAPIKQRIPWVAFDLEEAERLAGQGTMVFVDVTADWCFTCKVNERLVLETDEIEEAFSTYGVVAMKADWTNRDDRIAAFLADHGKYGIPFYLLYRPGREAHVFSELLTKDAILSKLAETGDVGVPF